MPIIYRVFTEATTQTIEELNSSSGSVHPIKAASHSWKPGSHSHLQAYNPLEM